MAEEMLRPMLQDWLDNNLPTLVERLVREEIERVARRGPADRESESSRALRRISERIPQPVRPVGVVPDG